MCACSLPAHVTASVPRIVPRAAAGLARLRAFWRGCARPCKLSIGAVRTERTREAGTLQGTSGVRAASKVDSSITLDSERANALGAFLSMDEYSPDALVASLEVFT